MPTDPSSREFTKRVRVRAKSSAHPDRVVLEPVRERVVPAREVIERLWWACAEALNTDIDGSFNGLGRYPDELAELYDQLRDSLNRFDPPETRAPAVLLHAERWRIRARDVHTSLRLAHIEESTLPRFLGPRLQMPVTTYRAGPRDAFQAIGPQHADPDQLVALARRRVRRIKGWTLDAIAAADERVVQSIAESLRAWAVLDREVP